MNSWSKEETRRAGHPYGGRMTSRTSRLVVAAALVALAGASALPASAAGMTQLHLDLDNGETLKPGTAVRDDSGSGAHGVVDVLFGGTIRSVLGVGGTRAARFPKPCTTEPCPNAMIRVDDRPGLDPGTKAFEWGATVKLAPAETSKGANVVQKGLFNEVGGQWKLQIDGGAGLPSCLVSGTLADGTTARTTVVAKVSVADGKWHQVTCRRTGTTVSVRVDGVVRGSLPASPVRVDSAAPVTIGAKSVKAQDNDQYFGALDDVFMRLI